MSKYTRVKNSTYVSFRKANPSAANFIAPSATAANFFIDDSYINEDILGNAREAMNSAKSAGSSVLTHAPELFRSVRSAGEAYLNNPESFKSPQDFKSLKDVANKTMLDAVAQKDITSGMQGLKQAAGNIYGSVKHIGQSFLDDEPIESDLDTIGNNIKGGLKAGSSLLRGGVQQGYNVLNDPDVAARVAMDTVRNPAATGVVGVGIGRLTAKRRKAINQVQ